MKYYAHTAEDACGKPLPESSGRRQPLKNHLQNVAALSRRFAAEARPGDKEFAAAGTDKLVEEKAMKEIIPAEAIERKIFMLRGRKVMLDRDLAALYGVKTMVLNQAVKRKIKRFPEDFMFRLTKTETRYWISQFVISNYRLKMGLRKPPCVFTQDGIAMLSSVLNSERAINVNIQIMRTFTRLKEIIASHKDLAARLDGLENKYDAQFKIVFDAIRQLMAEPEKPRKRIGFTAREKRAGYLSPAA